MKAHDLAAALAGLATGEVQTAEQDGAKRVSVAAGSVFVVPRGLWHRQVARPSVTLLTATPDHSEVSTADDPRS